MCAEVEVRIVGHVADRAVEDELPSIKRMFVLIVSRHIDFTTFQPGESIVDSRSSTALPVEWQVRPRALWVDGRWLAVEDGRVVFIEVKRLLCLNLSWFWGLEGTYAGEADACVFGLGYVDDAGGVGSAVADCVDFVDEGEG